MVLYHQGSEEGEEDETVGERLTLCGAGALRPVVDIVRGGGHSRRRRLLSSSVGSGHVCKARRTEVDIKETIGVLC